MCRGQFRGIEFLKLIFADLSLVPVGCLYMPWVWKRGVGGGRMEEEGWRIDCPDY